jgi:hypothetical protein
MTSASLRIWICLILLSAASSGKAQKDRYLSNRVGIVSHAVRDELMSPLTFAGAGFFISLKWRTEKITQSDHILFQYSTGTMRNSFSDPIDFQTFNLMTYTFYHQPHVEDALFNWGWSNFNSLQFRNNAAFTNNSRFFEYSTTFGPAVRFQYPMTIWGKSLWWEIWGNVQLLGFYLRPSFTSPSPDGYLDPDNNTIQSFLRSLELFAPHQAIQFNWRPGIYFPFKTANRISLHYLYEYYQLHTPKPISSSSGIWMVSLSTKI